MSGWRDRFRARLRPQAADLAFALVLVWCLARLGPHLLDDSDTMWHMRLGDDILRTATLPASDTLSSTRLGTHWVNQSWGFDVILALVMRLGGWSGVIGATALTISWTYWMLARGLTRAGFSTLAVLASTILAARLGMIHYLARPHIVSFAFFAWFLLACRDLHRGSSHRLRLAPILMIVWANMHGGFVSGWAALGVAIGGHALNGPWDSAWRKRLFEFAAILGLCLIAPLVNPQGVGLYRHVFGFLGSFGASDLNSEFQPLQFQESNITMGEWLVIALIALPSLSRSPQTRYDLAQSLAWMHLGLASVRYLPFFGIASAPGIARMIQGTLPAQEDASQAESVRLNPPWVPWASTLILTIGVGMGLRLGGLNPERYPTGAMATINALPLDEPIFHEMNWGGVISWECRPRRLNRIDNRFEVFGYEMIWEHLSALEGGEAWRTIEARDGFRTVWLKPERPLAQRLEADPAHWRVLHKDRVSIVLRRTGDIADRRSQSLR